MCPGNRHPQQLPLESMVRPGKDQIEAKNSKTSPKDLIESTETLTLLVTLVLDFRITFHNH
jgi:hypothetical protein